MNSTTEPVITILMATYNGGTFIQRQLDSILAQTYTNWQLLIRDDGSTDNTPEIINTYIRQHPNIRLVINRSSIKGARANFSALFDSARADSDMQYIMFCDQDDIWKPEKIERSLYAMREMEKSFPAGPILIYGNLELMDGNDRFVAGELKLKHHIRLRNLMSYNYALGCTMLLNRYLIDDIGTIPLTSENHDYWVALVASMYHSQFIREKLIRYRQHGQNASGNVAGNNKFWSRIKRHFMSPGREIAMLRARFVMLKDFFKRYGHKLSPADRKVLREYLKAYTKGRLSVCYVILKNRIFRKGLLQSAALLYHVLFFFKSIKAKSGV